MGKLKLYGMKAAYDEILTTAIKRQHEPQRIIGELLTAEISEKQARSIKYQMTIARLPLAKEIDEFDFAATPVNETLARDLAGGDFLQHQRNVVLIGGTGTGKTHLAVAIARALATEPSLLLMDEPFGALDEIVRDRLNEELLKLWARTGKTIGFVTHSIPEAVYLSTKIVVMSPRPGRISDVIDSPLPRERPLEIRDGQAFIDIAHRVREGLRAGHVED